MTAVVAPLDIAPAVNRARAIKAATTTETVEELFTRVRASGGQVWTRTRELVEGLKRIAANASNGPEAAKAQRALCTFGITKGN